MSERITMLWFGSSPNQSAMFKYMLVNRQLSIYWLFASLVVTAAMMHPSFATLIVALPANALILLGMRWVAHMEGKLMAKKPHDYP